MSEAYEPEEILQQLDRMGRSGYENLRITAFKLAQGHPHLLGEALLHQAISDTCSGKRQWPKGLPPNVYFYHAMRSIRSERNRVIKRNPVTSPDAPAFINQRDQSIGPEQQLIEKEEEERKEEYAKIFITTAQDSLKNDTLALVLFENLLDRKYTKTEIIKKYNCSVTNYDSAQRKVRRTLARIGVKLERGKTDEK